MSRELGKANVPQIWPVLDVLNRQVVHAVGGRRSEYRPWITRWTDSSDPLDVAKAMRRQTGASRLYLADLDGILRRTPNRDLWRHLCNDGWTVLVDPGIAEVADLRWFDEIAGLSAIIALESCHGIAVWRIALEKLSPARCVFSLDLRGGVPNTQHVEWRDCPPEEIVRQVASVGGERLIILDLADVGTCGGGSTHSLLSVIRDEFPDWELIAGGGVRTHEDVARWEASGANGVLVATALHEGSLAWPSSRIDANARSCTHRFRAGDFVALKDGSTTD